MSIANEKRQPDVEVNQISPDSDHVVDAKWETGVKRRFPWLGLVALVVMSIAAGGAVAVLLCSDGKTEGQWARYAKIKPSVFLASINAVFNICLAILIGQGVAIAWWRKALKGKTVSELHRTWSFSTSALDLVLGIGKWNTVAVAALSAKIAIMDGILLQRATSAFSSMDYESHNKTITGAIVTELPTGFTGYYSGNTGAVGSLTPNFASIVRLWSIMPGQIDEQYFYSAAGGPGDSGQLYLNCVGSCELSIPAAGFSVECDTTAETINYGKQAASYMDTHTLQSPDYPLLSTSFTLVVSDEKQPYTSIVMDLQYMDSQSAASNDSQGSCPGTFNRKVCTLRPAVVSYPIIVTGSKSTANQQGYSISGGRAGVTMVAPVSDLVTQWGQSQTTDFLDTDRQLDGFHVDKYTDTLDSRPESDAPTTLGGVQLALENLFGASANVTWSDSQGWQLSQDGNFAQTWLPPNAEIDQFCNYSMTDPTRYLIRQINSIMLTASIYAASQNESIWYSPQNYTALETTDTIYYQTHRTFLWLALASMLVCIICVLPAYYGFWELGRKVSLGPFEIAAAFQAPVLDHPSAATGEVGVLLKEVGHRKVQYGKLTVEPQGRLAVAEPDVVERPALPRRPGHGLFGA